MGDNLCNYVLTRSKHKTIALYIRNGDKILYRGKEYQIAAKEGSRMGFDDGVFYMPLNLAPEQIKATCVQIYRMLAKCDLAARTFNFAKHMGVIPSAVKINGAKIRWSTSSLKPKSKRIAPNYGLR